MLDINLKFLFVRIGFLFVTLYSISVQFFCDSIPAEYNSYIFVTILYFIMLLFFVIRRRNYVSIFYLIFNIISFLRYSVLPCLVVKSSYFYGRALIQPQKESLYLASFLMCYELIVSFIVVELLENKLLINFQLSFSKLLFKVKKTQSDSFIYVFISLIVVILFILKRTYFPIVHFAFPKDIADDDVSTIQMLFSYLFFMSKNILFIFLLLKFRFKQWWLILFVLILNISFFVGSNRSDFLITSISSLIIVKELVPAKKFQIVNVVILTVIVGLFLILTNERNYASISGGDSEMIDKTEMIRSYSGGQYNIALATEIDSYYEDSNNLSVLIFDFFRPMIGPNLILKRFNYEYSNIFFNKRIFFSDHRSQIIPMLGQSYLFLGACLAPLFTVLFISLAYYLGNIVVTTSNYYLKYICMLSFARIGFLFGQNSMNIVNDLSLNFTFFIIIYVINKILLYVKKITV